MKVPCFFSENILETPMATFIELENCTLCKHQSAFKPLHLPLYLPTHHPYMNWFILIVAGLFEVGFATCLAKAKESTGSTATWWLVGFLVSLSISMLLLYKATQTLPIGTAYAVWTGIGAVGTVIVGILFFKEPAEFWRLFFIVTLIASVVGLKYVSN